MQIRENKDQMEGKSVRFSIDEGPEYEEASPVPMVLAPPSVLSGGATAKRRGSVLTSFGIENYNRFIAKLRQLLLGAELTSDNDDLEPKSPINRKKQIENLFKLIDVDNSGKLSRVEFSNFISSEELGLFDIVEHKTDYDDTKSNDHLGLLRVTAEEKRDLIKMLIEQIDNNHDGYISFKELEEFLSVVPATSASADGTTIVESGMLYSVVRSAIRELLVSNGYDIFSGSQDNNVIQMLASSTNDLSKVRGGQSMDKKVFIRLLLTLDIPKLNRENNKLTNDEAATVANHLDHSNKGIVTASDLKKWLLGSLTAREKSKILIPLLVFIHERYDDKIESFFTALNAQADVSSRIYSADFIDRLKVLGVKCKDYDQLFGACLYSNSNDHWITLESIEDSITSAREYIDVKEYLSATSPMPSTPVSTHISTAHMKKVFDIVKKEIDVEDQVDISCSVEKKGIAKVWRPSSKKPHLAVSAHKTTKKQRQTDDLNNSTSPIRRRDGKLIHLGGGAAGMGVKQLVNEGYRFHTGKWKGWPFDYWDCCRSRDKMCPNFIKKQVKIPVKDILENKDLAKGEETFIDKTLEREQKKLALRSQKKDICFVLSKESLPIDKGLGHTGPITLYEKVNRPLEYNGKTFESVAYIKDKHRDSKEAMAVKYFVTPQVAPPAPPVVKLFKFEKSEQKEGELDSSTGKPIIYPFELSENSEVYIDLRKLDSMIEKVDEVLDNRPLPPEVKEKTDRIILDNKKRKDIIHEIATNIRSEYEVKSQALLSKIVHTFENKVSNINDRIKNQDTLLLVELEKIKAANINIVIDNEKHHQAYRHLVGKIEKRIGELLIKSKAQDNYILDETKSQRRALITLQQNFNDYRLDNSSKLVTAIRRVIVEELENKNKKLKTWRPAGALVTPSSSKEPITPAGVWRPVSKKQYTPRPAKEAPAPPSRTRTPSKETPSRVSVSREKPSRETSPRVSVSRETPSRETPSRETPSRVSTSRKTPTRETPSRVSTSNEKPVRETSRSVKHTHLSAEATTENDTKSRNYEDISWEKEITNEDVVTRKKTIKLSIEDKDSWLRRIRAKVSSIITT